MDDYKFYRKDNYIFLSNNFTKESFYGFVKEVLVDKSNLNKPHYRFFNIKDWNSDSPIFITQLLKEDNTPYTQVEFEVFYTQNTGNFNGGGTAPGVQTVTGTGVNNTDPYNPIITINLSPSINIVPTGNFTIPDGVRTRIITFTSIFPQEINLPAISDAIGSIYFITNDSLSTVNIKSKTGSNDIWDSMVLTNDKMIDIGTTQRIINDGVNYKIL